MGKFLSAVTIFFLVCMLLNSSAVIFAWKQRPKDSFRKVTTLKESCHSWDKLRMTLQGRGFTDLAEEIFISQKSEKPGMTCACDEIHLFQKLKNPVRAAIFQYGSVCLCKQLDETLTSSRGRVISVEENKKSHKEHLSLKVTG